MGGMKILIVGFGNMGAAMVNQWLKADLLAPSDTHIVGRALPLKNLNIPQDKINLYQSDDVAKIAPDAINMVVLCVRPQIMRDILPLYKKFSEQNIPFITVAAGLKDAFYREHLGDNAQIIRVMPNMPTAIGCGMNAVYYNQNVSEQVKQNVKKLMNGLGQVEILQKEEEMDAFTALAGSGPAYGYLLVEAMAKAAIKLGLNPETAEQIALETVLGAGQYLKQHQGNAESLREEIALPGGVTEAALSVFMKENIMFDLVESAMRKATTRSETMGIEMGKQ